MFIKDVMKTDTVGRQRKLRKWLEKHICVSQHVFFHLISHKKSWQICFIFFVLMADITNANDQHGVVYITAVRKSQIGCAPMTYKLHTTINPLLWLGGQWLSLSTGKLLNVANFNKQYILKCRLFKLEL